LTGSRSCAYPHGNIGGVDSVRGASSACASPDETAPEMLFAENIARVLRTLDGQTVPLRTIRYRLAAWHERDLRAGRAPAVVRLPRKGVGGVRWAVPLDAWCASRGMDPDEVRAVLGQRQRIAA